MRELYYVYSTTNLSKNYGVLQLVGRVSFVYPDGLVGLVREYDRSVVFISNGADDECGVRKQPIVVVRCPLDKHSRSRPERGHGPSKAGCTSRSVRTPSFTRKRCSGSLLRQSHSDGKPLQLLEKSSASPDHSRPARQFLSSHRQSYRASLCFRSRWARSSLRP